MLDQKTLENMVGDLAKLLCGCLADNPVEVSLHTEGVTLKSRTVVQVFASTPTGNGLFTINVELKNF